MEKCICNEKFIYAIDINKFDDVEKLKTMGANGALHCFGCNEEVIYKSGPKRRGHFAHKRNLYCEYNKYIEEYSRRFPLLASFKERLFESLKKDNNYSIDIDAKVIDKHWTDLLIKFEDGDKFAIEFDNKDMRFTKMAAFLDSYKARNINCTWFITAPVDDITREEMLYNLIRLRLNKSDNTVFLIDENKPENLFLCKLDNRVYQYTDSNEVHVFKENLFYYRCNIEQLSIKGKMIYIDGFNNEYQKWIDKREEEFHFNDNLKRGFRQVLIEKGNDWKRFDSPIEHKVINRVVFRNIHSKSENKLVIERNVLELIDLHLHNNPYAWNNLLEFMLYNPCYLEVVIHLAEFYKEHPVGKLFEKVMDEYERLIK